MSLVCKLFAIKALRQQSRYGILGWWWLWSTFLFSKEFPMLGIIFAFSIAFGLVQGFSGK